MICSIESCHSINAFKKSKGKQVPIVFLQKGYCRVIGNIDKLHNDDGYYNIRTSQIAFVPEYQGWKQATIWGDLNYGDVIDISSSNYILEGSGNCYPEYGYACGIGVRLRLQPGRSTQRFGTV